MKRILTREPILAANDAAARAVRERLGAAGIFAVNLIGSPGSGKTTLLEATVVALPGVRMGIIEGDLATDRDARRLAALGVPAVQLNTGSGCHLDAAMVLGALERLPLVELELLFIENVGNLVCPAAFDLGEAAKAVVLSVAEGEDKPEKYAPTFLRAQAVVVTKADLAPHVGVDPHRLAASARAINPALVSFVVSARSGEGLDDWRGWLAAKGVE
ncbi:MAG: hydrogenase nickel incorporation protein HypB [Thermaerobacter sp.]|nr:hydrogenase nickel incorporation protein HypB [Thermaerobacter sp.]